MAVSPVVTEVGFGSTPTVETLNTDPAFEQIKTELTVDPLSTNLTPTTETINLGALRDMGFLPQPQVLVDQALHMGIDATTGLALDPATADLASQYKVAALANSPKFIEQGYRSDIMNAMAAGAFYGYVQTLEATDPDSLDAYRIAEGNIYLTGQLADNRLVVTFVDDDGFHYLRSNTEGGDMLLAFIRDNNVSEQSVNAMIRRGIDKGMFSHVPHAAVESVAQVVLDNTPGLHQSTPTPAPIAPNDLPSLPAERFSGTFTENNNVYTLETEQGTKFTLTNLTTTLLDPTLDDGTFEHGAIEIRSPFFSDEAGLEAGAILGVRQLPSQSVEAATDDGPVITGGGGLREFTAKLFGSYNPDLGDNASFRILGEAGIVDRNSADSHWAAREVYDNTELALRLAIEAGMGGVTVGGSIGQEGPTTVMSLYGQLITGEVGLRLEANTTDDGGLEPTLRFVHAVDGQDLTNDAMRENGSSNALVIQVSPGEEGGVDVTGRLEFNFR